MTNRTPDDTASAAAQPAAALSVQQPVLLYDGLCGFCNGTVRFVLARDPGGAMRFAPLQGEFAATLLERRPDLRRVDSLLLVTPGSDPDVPNVAIRSTAALEIGIYLGGAWAFTARLARLVPRPVRDRVYDLFARFRYRIFGRYDSCPLPDPAVRARFLA